MRDRLCEVIAGYQYSYTCEDELQRAIASVLTDSGIPHQREFPLNKRDKIDFLVGRIGIEVKIKEGLTAVTRQVHRYAQSDLIDSLILVTAKASHRGLPREMSGKPVSVVYLSPL